MLLFRMVDEGAVGAAGEHSAVDVELAERLHGGAHRTGLPPVLLERGQQPLHRPRRHVAILTV